MRILKDQTFWTGAMSAFAIVFFALFVGMATDKVAFNNSGSAQPIAGAGAPAAAPGGYGEPAAPVEITVSEVTDADFVRGDRDAKVSVVEFSDIDCPFCARFHETMKKVLASYEGQINWVYRDFPLDSLHPQATAKAVAADCVGKLTDNDTYWKYLDALFVGSAADEVTAEATKLGVDAAAFEACQQDPEMTQAVKDEMAEGAAAGAQGTPYSVIVVGDETIPVNGAVPEAQLIASIEQALALQ